ncbi:MAG TPA: SDR family oxidoreductase [Chitinophagaceae bacterium]|nr:SDR family oxidoreductase [Chitinophagaceae bacterium]
MDKILVVGGSSGIGARLVSLLAETGHEVYSTYFQHPPAHPASDVSHHYCNVLDEAGSWDFLPAELHGMSYCPGTIQLRPFARLRPVDFESDFRLQVTGAVRAIQAALPALKASGRASIVLFSTVAVRTGLPFHAQVATSKGAVEGLARALAAELAPSIRVNVVAPSLTDTPLAASLFNTEEKRAANAQRHPLKRTGTVEDIAQAAAFLLTDRSSWMTGQVLHVDGGLSVIR